MSTGDSKRLVQQWFGVAMNCGSADQARSFAEDVFAADFRDHDGIDGGTSTRAAFLDTVVDKVFGAFSDIEVTIEQLFGEGDLVAVRYRFDATHTGEFMAIPATGRRIRHTENEIYRTAGGRVVESWGEGSWLATIRQLQGAEAPR
jgi:predicted ester cyclase